MLKTITLDITQSVIDTGVPETSNDCALAVAIRGQLKAVHVRVTLEGKVYVQYRRGAKTQVYNMTARAIRWIHQFDEDSSKCKPFKTRLTWSGEAKMPQFSKAKA